MLLLMGKDHELEIAVVDGGMVLRRLRNLQTLLKIGCRLLQIAQLIAILRNIGEHAAYLLQLAHGFEALTRYRQQSLVGMPCLAKSPQLMQQIAFVLIDAENLHLARKIQSPCRPHALVPAHFGR
ncbi:hypothetical protein SDC9_192105 [bioreactor metagenome]|uniref:Uncharacterized protein n=1 Tax=bioreactor metagenome TaxID=1076179 RepID=A0A645I048_9ZZZZ